MTITKNWLFFNDECSETISSNSFNTISIANSSISKTYNYLKIKVGSGVTTMILSNEEKNDIMKIIKSLEESDLLIKKKKLKMEQKNP